MAVGALDQALVHAVMKRHIKLGLLLEMAGIAELRLRLDQQVFFRRCVVRRMAIDAAYLVLPVERIRAIEMSWVGRMAGEAPIIDLFRGMFRENENLRDISAARHVLRPWAVTILAAVLREATFFVCLFPVRALLPAVVNVFVAGLANLRTHILSPGGVFRIRRRCRRRLWSVFVMCLCGTQR